MTSLVKKVLKRGSGKKNHHGNKKEAATNGSKSGLVVVSQPINPPSPDLSGLSPEEVVTIKDVIKRQEQFEHQESERFEKLREHVEVYEEEVKKFASQKSKLKQVDLRLCRLCYKTKFADGIGKACADCHKRVCNKCGSFSKHKPNSKKSKGKWRCSMCQMKRDMVAMSGVWYHGNEGKPVAASALMKKFSLSEMDSSENDQSLSLKFSGTDVTVEDKESDVFSSDAFTPIKKGTPTKKPSRLRHRSTSLSEQGSVDIEDDMYIDVDQFHLERQRCREQRLSKRCRKRLRSSGSQDHAVEGETDSDRRLSETFNSPRRERSSSDQLNSSENGRRPYVRESDGKMYHSKSDIDNSDSGREFRQSRDHRRRPMVNHDSIKSDSDGLEYSTRSCRGYDPRYQDSVGDTHEQSHRGYQSPRLFQRSNQDSINDNSDSSCRNSRRSSNRGRRSKQNSIERSNDREYSSRDREENRDSIRRDRYRDGNKYGSKVVKQVSREDDLYHNKNNENGKRESRHSVYRTLNTQQGDVIPPLHKQVPLNNEMVLEKPVAHIKPNTNHNMGSLKKTSARETRKSRESCTSRESRESRYSRSSATSRDSFDQSPSISKLSQSKLDSVQRHKDHYQSSSSSIFSDYKTSDCYEDSSCCERSDVSPSRTTHSDMGEHVYATKPSIQNKKEIQQLLLSSNCLSPDMALRWESSKRQRKGRNLDVALFPHRSGSVSPKGSDNLRRPSKDSHCRRMTLSQCENILLTHSSFENNLVMAGPHEIIIHKDKEDQSVRTNGLGMRVVGGRSGPGGTLGAYVTCVIKGGPADAKNISEGDQIIEWNGRSLINVTFEESQEILKKSGDIVQIIVIHSLADPSINPSVRSRHPIIVRAESLDGPEPFAADRLSLENRKRRMLPKTPIEIKRDVRHISGSIWMQLDYDSKCECLIIVLLRGEDILAQHNGERSEPNVLAMLYLLPKRTLHDGKETEVKPETTAPQWNETFVFPNIAEDELAYLSLEVTVWDIQEEDEEFLGEVLLDLSEAQIDNTPTCYHLEDHDENSSPLPYRKKSFTYSESSAVSPVNSLDASSLYPSQNPSPRSSISTKANGSQRTLPITPAHDKIRELISAGKRSPVFFRLTPPKSKHLSIHGSKSDSNLRRARSSNPLSRDFTSSDSPLHSPTSPKEDGTDEKHHSLSSLLRKKVSAVAKLSSSLIMGNRKLDGIDNPALIGRSKSYSDISESNMLQAHFPKEPRRSFETHSKRFEFLAPPYQLSRPSSSTGVLCDSLPELETVSGIDRLAPEGDDITSVLGPGQIAPMPSYETNVCGDIKMGYMVSKGQLEIDVVVVRGLTKSGMSQPPDTYVKTYLVAGTKTVQKKKTQTVRASFDPVFRKTVKYSACNIHGRCIKVNVWEKQKTFDKKRCLGEAVVKLDNLDLSQHTSGWYKLFPLGATEFCSSESLNYWGYG